MRVRVNSQRVPAIKKHVIARPNKIKATRYHSSLLPIDASSHDCCNNRKTGQTVTLNNYVAK